MKITQNTRERECYERERVRFDEMEANIAAEIDSRLGEQLVGSDLQRRLGMIVFVTTEIHFMMTEQLNL